MRLTERANLKFTVKEEILECIKEYVRTVLKCLSQNSVEIYLFGSLAKGG